MRDITAELVEDRKSFIFGAFLDKFKSSERLIVTDVVQVVGSSGFACCLQGILEPALQILRVSELNSMSFCRELRGTLNMLMPTLSGSLKNLDLAVDLSTYS